MRSILLVALALALAGCAPVNVVTVLSQADSALLRGKKRWVVLPVDFGGVRVGDRDEATYLGTKTEEQRKLWEADKGEVAVRFAEALVEAAAASGLEIAASGQGPGVRVRALRIEPGYYAGISAAPARVKIDVMISIDGQPADHVLIEEPGFGYSVTQRLSNSGKAAGKTMATYLAGRFAPQVAQ